MNWSIPQLEPEVLEQIYSPSLVILRDRVVANIDRMIAMAGSARRLRPHCKTHKMPAVVTLLLERGVERHKAATIAEAEMLADAGAPDVLLAYNPVGPNVARIVELMRQFPACRFSVTADHSRPLRELSAAAAERDRTCDVFLDLNVGMGRTGVVPESPDALALVRQIASQPGTRLAGLHVYDGHVREADPQSRRDVVQRNWSRVQAFCDACAEAGHPPARMVCGGTPTFPMYCEIDDDRIELSPGTSVLFDVGYGDAFPDLPFEPAAVLVTRVISRPAEDCLTLDLGTKAVASDPPKGARVHFPALPDAEQIGHNEEHLILRTPAAGDFTPGDPLLAIPVHVCPTSNLYDRVPVVDRDQVVDHWDVAGRTRVITV